MGVLDFWNIAVFILIFGLTMLWTLAMHQHPKQPSSSVTKLEFENMGQLTLEHCNSEHLLLFFFKFNMFCPQTYHLLQSVWGFFKVSFNVNYRRR